MNLAPELELSEKQTTAWNYLEDKFTNEILYGGGAGSGKSYLGCIWHIYRRLTYPGSRGLIGRAKIANLEQSTLVTLFKVANLMGYKQGVHYNYNSQKHTITWANGSQTILKDLFLYPSDPDFVSLGSTEYTDAFIDEAIEITQKALEIVSTRIRYKLDEFNLVPKVFLTCNPGDGWLKERYIEKDGQPIILQNHQKFIPALVTDNPDEQFKALYIGQLSRMSSEYDKQRLLYGSWNEMRENENPFAFAWDEKKHISNIPEYDFRKQLILSIDFNVDPFCILMSHYWADKDGEHLHIFDEMEIKNGSIPEMIDRVKAKYSSSLPMALLTGDALGLNRQITQRDNASLYKQLLKGLGMKERQLRVTSNPTHKTSRAECNYLLSNFPDFKIKNTCIGLIRDMRNVQVDAGGGIIKSNRKDLNQHADFLDGFRYIVFNIMYRWVEKHQNQHKLIH